MAVCQMYIIYIELCNLFLIKYWPNQLLFYYFVKNKIVNEGTFVLFQPSKSEVIGCCGGKNNEWSRR